MVEVAPFAAVVVYTELMVDMVVVAAGFWTGAWMVLVMPLLTTTSTVLPALVFCLSEEAFECIPDVNPEFVDFRPAYRAARPPPMAARIINAPTPRSAQNTLRSIPHTVASLNFPGGWRLLFGGFKAPE